jgi:SAM-dependent methyltransferase
LYLLLNVINNHFWPGGASQELVIKDFVTTIDDSDWNSSHIKASPVRRLCELFLAKLPWGAIKSELGQINVFDTGCGSGGYAPKLSSLSGDNIDSYVGVDIQESLNWDKVKTIYPNYRFYRINSAKILNYIPKETNFFLTLSSLEHFDNDLIYFKQVREFIVNNNINAIQVHLIPSTYCLWLFLYHGIRQYNPRTISKITRMFDDFSYSLLFNLGGKHCNSLHYNFITKPALILNKGDMRDTMTQEYDRLLLSAIKEDMQRPQKSPSFHALFIHSNYQRKLF